MNDRSDDGTARKSSATSVYTTPNAIEGHAASPRTGVAGVPLTARVGALAVTALISVLVPLIATADIAVSGRPLLVAAFMICVPGVPVALALGLPNLLATAALAVAASFSYHVLFGTFAIVAPMWHPVGSSWIATGVGLVFTIMALRREQRRPAAMPATWADRVRARVVDRATLINLGLLLTGALFWFWETQTIQLDDAAAYGLFQVISWRYVVALIFLAAATVNTLLPEKCDHLVLTMAATLWAIIGYTTVAVADGNGNVPTGWVHVAFIDYISVNGAVPASFDARFSWPGYFSAGAQMVALGGTVDARSFLVFAPVIYFLVVLPGLLLIARTITRSWRWSWIAVFVFLATNWYQQDYFSPQATAFVIYVAILGTLLWMSDATKTPRLHGTLAVKIKEALKRTPPLPAGVTAGTAQGLGLLLAVLCAGIVVDHQLTPFTLIFALVGFTITGRIRYRLLWVTASLMFVGYFSYGATDFWVGHLESLLGDLGQVSNAINSGVGGRIVGDASYQSNQYVRIAWSLLLFVGGAMGVWIIRRRSDSLLLAGLSAAPFALLIVQSYGGEVVIRSFLYASPFLAPLFAVAVRGVVVVLRKRFGKGIPDFAASPSRSSAMALAGLVPVVVIAGLVLTFTRGLNTGFERTPPDQATASQLVKKLAVPGDTVALPLFAGLTPPPAILDVKSQVVDVDSCVAGGLITCLEDPLPRFVLISITQDSTGQLTQNRPKGWVWTIGQQLIDSGRYTRVFSGTDAWPLELTQEGS